MDKKPCLAITLVNPRQPQEAGSYLWCKLDSHMAGMHTSYCGVWWLSQLEDLVKPTPNMILWRTGTKEEVEGVSGRLLG